MTVEPRPAAEGDTAPVLQRLNTAKAMAILGDDPLLYAQALSFFCEDAPNQLAQLDAALASGDYAAASRAAHSLKGTAATLGAERLSAQALKMEKACKSSNQEMITAIDPDFRAELHATLAVMS